jgi:hypothetical protein
MTSLIPKARDAGLLVQELPDELLIYDTVRSQTHCLNATAALVWRHCDGERTVAGLASKVAPDLSPEDGEALVLEALAQLAERHLLDEPVAPAAIEGRLSRRKILGIGFAVGLAVPMVESIVSPPSALAQSGGGTTGATINGIPGSTGP